ncbi:hypothetical protein [Mycobacterium sp. 1164966.3]|uniref:hypothetical protein n=1 Tax=Mycobacterium sp. 1164966.3 TaxID=1856861 RepID=UPI0020A4F006|nr:hypothetical protein [Mycobacterium sp. 1164966.3]
MTAEPNIGLVQGDPVPPRQHVSGGQAGHAAPNDRYRASKFLLHISYSEPPAGRTAQTLVAARKSHGVRYAKRGRV